MKKYNKLLKNTSIILGLTAIAFFVFDYFIFNSLRPKMIRFEAINAREESLMHGVGISLLIFLAFYLLSLLQLVKYLRKAKKFTFFSLILIVAGVLSMLGVFSDLALLGDIGKQYRHGFAQPEWLIVYPIMAFQFITAVIFTYLHFFGFKQEDQVKHVVQDSNVFLIVHYVGLVCGLIGLLLASLGFVFFRAWRLDIHTTISSIILLIPYILAVVYWFLVKLQEKTRQWYDEKQIQDVGKSAFVTLIVSVIFMTVLFIANYTNLGGVISIIWLPLHLFSVLFFFSASNLYFSGKN